MLRAIFKKNRELWYAVVAIAVTTAAYVIFSRLLGSLPAARGLAGHGIGVLGFVLMLMTETLYTLRKRSTRARWGRMSGWLRFHMVTGLVGSYMVLLHPAAQFHGLAGVVALFTVVVVISGLVGRYLYTAVPRAIDGTELEASEVEARMAQADSVSAAETSYAGLGAPAASGTPSGAVAVQATALGGYPARPPAPAAPADGEVAVRFAAPNPLGERTPDPRALADRRHALDRQLKRLATARRTLATWRAFHVPMTMVLFITAFVHIGGAIYYATLLH